MERNIYKFDIGAGIISEDGSTISFNYDFRYCVNVSDISFRGVMHLSYSEYDTLEGMQDYCRSIILGWFYELFEDDEVSGELSDMIKKKGSKFVVTSKDGKKLGEHNTEAAAKKQLAAIEISKKKKK